MKPVLIIENCSQSLNLITESATESKRKYEMSGVFTEFNKLNRNQRIYTPERFLPCLEEFQSRIAEFGEIYGEYDHPDIFDTSIQKSSHLIGSAVYVKEQNAVIGNLRLLNNRFGKEARSLVDDNCPIYVSSRAAGVTESNGYVNVKKLFTYDIVADPGFASAKMYMNNINESMGFDPNANFRIFDMSNDTKINELITMNNNDEYVTRDQMKEYSDYLTSEIGKMETKITSTIKEGKIVDTPDLENFIEMRDSMYAQQKQIMEYVGYLSNEFKSLIDDNKELKEKLDHSISFAEHIAKNVKQNKKKVREAIAFTEHVAEHTQNNIKYAEYIMERLSESVDFIEYVAENTDNGIKFIEYVAENTDNGIKFIEYVAENTANGIKFIEYVAENTSGALKHNDYLAEHIEDNIAYLKYIKEKVEDSYVYAEKNLNIIAEKLNNGSLNEAVISIETPTEFLGLQDDVKEEDDDALTTQAQAQTQDAQAQDAQAQIDGDAAQAQTQDAQVDDAQAQADDAQAQTQPVQTQTDDVQPVEDVDVQDDDAQDDVQAVQPEPKNGLGTTVKISGNTTGVVVEVDDDGTIKIQKSGEDDIDSYDDDDIEPIYMEDDKEDLTETIKSLIEEAKKRDASEVAEPQFFSFLTEAQRNDFKILPSEQRENIINALNESEYYSQHDVMSIIRNTLSVPAESAADKLISKIPSDLQPLWEAASDTTKANIIAQSKFFQLNSDEAINNFWGTRKLQAELPINEGRIEVPVNYSDEKFTDNEIDNFINRFQSL